MKSNVSVLDLSDLRSRLAAFEDRYGVTSEHLYDAFITNGVLKESADFREWSFLYGTLQDAVAAHCTG